MKPFIYCITVLLFCSCGNKFSLLKRKYTNGFYFSSNHAPATSAKAIVKTKKAGENINVPRSKEPINEPVNESIEPAPTHALSQNQYHTNKHRVHFIQLKEDASGKRYLTFRPVTAGPVKKEFGYSEQQSTRKASVMDLITKAGDILLALFTIALGIILLFAILYLSNGGTFIPIGWFVTAIGLILLGLFSLVYAIAS